MYGAYRLAEAAGSPAAVAERLACVDGAVRRRPSTQSVNAGTSNVWWAYPTGLRPKGCVASLTAPRETVPALTATAVGASRGSGNAPARGSGGAGPGPGPAPEAPRRSLPVKSGGGRPPPRARSQHRTKADTRGLVEHTLAARECLRRNSATWPRTLGRRGALVATQRASGDCLLKTQDPANSREAAQGLTPAQCRKATRARPGPRPTAGTLSPGERRP